MTNPLDLEPIKALADDPDRGDVGWIENNERRVMAALDSLIAEVERLRNERGFWREATHHLSTKRGSAWSPPGT